MEKITRRTPPPRKDAKSTDKSKEKPDETLEPKLSEEKKDEPIQEQSNEKEFTSHEEFKKNLKPEQEPKKAGNSFDFKSKENVDHSETIDLDPKKSQIKEDTTVKVNFMNPNAMEDFIKKSTEKGSAKDGEQETGNASAGPGTKPETQGDNASDGNAFSEADFQDFAEVFMDILDMGISTGLRFWSKDTATTEYELDANKKRRLVRQLTKLFMKYQTKFSLEFMFIVTLVIAYSVPVSKANKRRKGVKEVGEEQMRRGPGQPRKR